MVRSRDALQQRNQTPQDELYRPVERREQIPDYTQRKGRVYHLDSLPKLKKITLDLEEKYKCSFNVRIDSSRPHTPPTPPFHSSENKVPSESPSSSKGHSSLRGYPFQFKSYRQTPLQSSREGSGRSAQCPLLPTTHKVGSRIQGPRYFQEEIHSAQGNGEEKEAIYLRERCPNNVLRTRIISRRNPRCHSRG